MSASRASGKLTVIEFVPRMAPRLSDLNRRVECSNCFWQRNKRLVFKVPHCKTGAELEAMVADARAKKQ